MITIPGNLRVWLATGHTDMRRGFRSLSLLVQETLNRDPHAGDLYVFRGRRSDLYPVHVITRKSLALMMRKLSVTESHIVAQLRGTFSRRKPSVASANWATVA